VERPGPAASVASGLAALGGVAAVVGAFLLWAELRVGGGQEFFGTPGQTVGAAGTGHWTGILALMGGVAAFLGAVGAVAFTDAPSRRRAAAVAAIAGLVVVVAAALGWWQREEIAVGGVPGGREALAFAREFVREFRREGIDVGAEIPTVVAGAGLWVSGAGGFLAAAGGMISFRASRR
jgi:hypothetical protein